MGKNVKVFLFWGIPCLITSLICGFIASKNQDVLYFWGSGAFFGYGFLVFLDLFPVKKSQQPPKEV